LQNAPTQNNLQTLFPESAKQPKQVLKMEVAVLKKLQGNPQNHNNDVLLQKYKK
jgi:hypothetical protein